MPDQTGELAAGFLVESRGIGERDSRHEVDVLTLHTHPLRELGEEVPPRGNCREFSRRGFGVLRRSIFVDLHEPREEHVGVRVC